VQRESLVESGVEWAAKMVEHGAFVLHEMTDLLDVLPTRMTSVKPPRFAVISRRMVIADPRSILNHHSRNETAPHLSA
jgi:hypothetical protein